MKESRFAWNGCTFSKKDTRWILGTIITCLILTIIVFALLLISGCTTGHGIYFRLPWSSDPPITVHAITPDHILEIPPGAKIEWDDMTILGPDGKKMVEVDGDLYYVEHWGNYISNFIQEEVMNAKVK